MIFPILWFFLSNRSSLPPPAPPPSLSLSIYIYICCCQVASVVSDSVRPQRWQPTRFPHPWDSPGKNPGVGCHFLLQCMHACWVTSVVSDSVRPYGQQPARLPCPWNFPGKNIGVGCHFLLQCMEVKSESEVAPRVRILATPWTAAYQAPPSMGFSRQEHWSGVPLASPLSLYIYICIHFL